MIFLGFSEAQPSYYDTLKMIYAGGWRARIQLAGSALPPDSKA
jgi:hypothetical protein